MQVFKPCSPGYRHPLPCCTNRLISQFSLAQSYDPFLPRFSRDARFETCLLNSYHCPTVHDSGETDYSFNRPRRPLAPPELSFLRRAQVLVDILFAWRAHFVPNELEMKLTFAVLASIATIAVAQGVTEILTPTSSPPAKCNPTYHGKFMLSVQALSKRGVEEVCLTQANANFSE